MAPMGTTRRDASCARSQLSSAQNTFSYTNHARARKRIPAEPNAIAVLHIAPLVLQGLVVHVGGLLSIRCRFGVVYTTGYRKLEKQAARKLRREIKNILPVA